MSAGPSEVVSVIRHDVRAGSEVPYEAWVQEVYPVAAAFPGHRSTNVIRPPHGSRQYTIVLHFDSLEHLRGWLESETRNHLLERVQPFLEAPGQVEIKPGMDFWIPAPGDRRAPAWKQFLVISSVIYPLSLIIPPVSATLFDAVPIRALFSSLVVVALMTWGIMPRYTRLVGGWLYRN